LDVLKQKWDLKITDDVEKKRDIKYYYPAMLPLFQQYYPFGGSTSKIHPIVKG
jgi:hypothetical protein